MADGDEKTFDSFFHYYRKMTVRTYVSKKRGRKGRSGMTLVELMIALFICSLLIILLLTVYGSFVKMSRFQSSSTDLENQFMLTSRVMEKDMRLAGFGLPGNGLYPKNIGAQNFYLAVLSNEDNKQTALFKDAQIGESTVTVVNTAGISANQWVGLVRDSTVVFYRITRVGLKSGSDTVVFKDSLIHVLWKKDSTQVYFAKGVQYDVEIKNGKKSLVRTSLTNATAIGEAVDSFAVCPKNRAGADLGADYSQAKVLGITLGGHVGAAGKTVAVTKSFDVDLRNSE
jgi:type II secretory pathway pseudopilin PulG